MGNFARNSTVCAKNVKRAELRRGKMIRGSRVSLFTPPVDLNPDTLMEWTVLCLHPINNLPLTPTRPFKDK